MNKDKITAMCHKVSAETGLTFNSVMTYYFLESVLSKLSNSKYNDKFIFKGGYILSNIVGLDSRSTVDIDFLIKNMACDKSLCGLRRLDFSPPSSHTVFISLALSRSLPPTASLGERGGKNDLSLAFDRLPPAGLATQSGHGACPAPILHLSHFAKPFRAPLEVTHCVCVCVCR